VRRFMLLLVLALLPLATQTVTAQPAEQVAQIIHVVRSGDTLYSIARYYGVTPEAIATANGIYNYNFIYVGQQLIIPMGGYTPPSQGYSAYYVRSGDTLARIARNYGTSVAAIAQLNGISNINRIYVGQLLYIPTGTPPPPTQIITYTVQYGDTLGRIARYYGTSVAALVSYNGIRNPNRIYAGTLLYIPIYW